MRGTDEEFERWLEQELQRAVQPLRGPSPRAAQAAYRAAASRGMGWANSTRIVASGTGKAAAGLVVATLALGGGMKAATAGTGSTNPMFWGAGVVEQAGSGQGPSLFGSQPVEATATPTPSLNPTQTPKRATRPSHGKTGCAGRKAKPAPGTRLTTGAGQ